MITEQEWTERYKQRIVDRLTEKDSSAQQYWTEEEAKSAAEAEFDGMGYEELQVFYENDPEGSADESLSYWEDGEYLDEYEE